MSEENGQGPKPAVQLFWDPEAQNVQVSVDTEQIKHWDFAAIVCEMGKQSVERTIRLGQVQALQRAAQEQAVDRELVRKLIH